MEILHTAFQMIPGARDDEEDSITKELLDVAGVSLGANSEGLEARVAESIIADREISNKLIIRTHANWMTKLFLVLFPVGALQKELKH